jgi:NhaP-type Na+/H+ or K+/H+ antiporter
MPCRIDEIDYLRSTVNPMLFAIWAVIVGILLITIALSGSLLKRLPLSTGMLYLAVGIGLGPLGWALMTPSALLHSVILEQITEVAVLISLFSAGLKLGLPLSDKHWRMPIRLAFVSMTLTVVLIAAIGIFGLGMSLGAAVLLGGILAPTDPVLASDVQVKNASDHDWLRFSLTGEGALNDGAAFPFVMLGLGLLGLHDLGAGGWQWLAIDVCWAIVAGLLIGGAFGALIGKLVVFLRSRHKESVGLDEFLVLGLIALAYGVSILSHAYGFLAVFAAGLAMQRVKEQDADGRHVVSTLPGPNSKQTQEERATDPKHASAYMMQAVKRFNEQLERIGEVAVVMVVGAMITFATITAGTVWFVLLLFVVVRPISVWLGLLGAPISRDQRMMISWFGIRGIGSIYYLMYAINQGLPRILADQIIAITLTAVTVSIVLHGISVTPLMNLYSRRMASRSRPAHS